MPLIGAARHCIVFVYSKTPQAICVAYTLHNARKRKRFPNTFPDGKSCSPRQRTKKASSIRTRFFGAADRTRTDTVSPPRDFKSLASAIPPQRHILFCFAFSLAVWKTHWMNIVHSSAIPPQRHRKFVCRIFRQTTKMIVARRTVFVNNYRLTFGRFVISSFFSGLRR